MTTITVKNLPDEVHRALKIRAARRGHTIEAEVHDILANAVLPPRRIKIGSALAAFGRKHGGIDLALERDSVSAVAPKGDEG